MSSNPPHSDSRDAPGSHSSRHSLQPRPHITQATNLPKEVNIILLDIAKLTTQSSTTVWSNEAIAVLRPFELEGILNPTLSRPSPSDSRYERWRFWTPVVARWLLSQVDDSIQRLVRNHGALPALADELFQTIKTMCSNNQRAYIQRQLHNWHNLKRGNYPTAADFIMAYQNQYNRLKIEGEEEPCGMALGRLLNELEGEFVRITFIRSEVNGMDREVDYRLFSYYCRLLINETRDFRDTDTGGGFDTGRGGGGGGSSGSGAGSFNARDVSYRGWRKLTGGRQPR